MGGACQHAWEHAVPKMASAPPRMSLSYRHVVDRPDGPRGRSRSGHAPTRSAGSLGSDRAPCPDERNLSRRGWGKMISRPVVVMGVAGSGKSVVGRGIAAALARPFIDADDLHPRTNIDKMRRGEPSTTSIERHGSTPSAPPSPATQGPLSPARRSNAPTAIICGRVHRGSRSCTLRAPAVIAKRMADRVDHFMPLSLLDDQLATLQPLEPDEAGTTVSIDGPVETVVRRALDTLA